MENKNIHVDGGHFRGLTRPVHADGGVSSDKVPTYSTRGPTLLERDIRENWLPLLLLLLHLHRFLSYAKVPWNRIRIGPGPRLPSQIGGISPAETRLVALGRHDDDTMTFETRIMYCRGKRHSPLSPIVCFVSRVVARVSPLCLHSGTRLS